MKTLTRKLSLSLIFFLALGFFFVGVIDVAEAVNIPYTFSPGTTARSSEVNANFSAVAGALPIAWASQNDISGDFYDTSNVYLNSLSITVPSNGILIITCSVNVRNSSASYMTMPRTIAYFDGYGITGFFNAFTQLDYDGAGTDSIPLSFTVSTSVTAGNHTVEHILRPQYVDPTYGAHWFNASMSVVFFPASQGSITGFEMAVPESKDESDLAW